MEGGPPSCGAIGRLLAVGGEAVRGPGRAESEPRNRPGRRHVRARGPAGVVYDATVSVRERMRGANVVAAACASAQLPVVVVS